MWTKLFKTVKKYMNSKATKIFNRAKNYLTDIVYNK